MGSEGDQEKGAFRGTGVSRQRGRGGHFSAAGGTARMSGSLADGWPTRSHRNFIGPLLGGMGGSAKRDHVTSTLLVGSKGGLLASARAGARAEPSLGCCVPDAAWLGHPLKIASARRRQSREACLLLTFRDKPSSSIHSLRLHNIRKDFCTGLFLAHPHRVFSLSSSTFLTPGKCFFLCARTRLGKCDGTTSDTRNLVRRIRSHRQR